MTEVAISLKNVSKCFKRYTQPIDRLKEVLRPGKRYANNFWALHNVTLEIFKGETIGIIGRNGSGKSTLLQIIAGTLSPTSGEVNVGGRVSALLELGSGFNPEFTGRQNVFFNGRVLGLSQAEIEEKLDCITAFADIGDFLDQPVKTYSSGMFVRLAFAVAVHVDPEILIVDEALAVGDIFFQQKCFQYLDKLKSQGVSVILVSHDMQAIVKLCDRAVILQDGYLCHSGSPSEMVAKYTELHFSQFIDDQPDMQFVDDQPDETPNTGDPVSQPLALTEAPLTSNQLEALTSEFSTEGRYGCAVGMIAGILTAGNNGQPKTIFEVGEEIVLSIQINEHAPAICPLNIGFQIKDRLGQVLIGTNTCFLGERTDEVLFGKAFLCQFKFRLAIAPGPYTVVVAVAEYILDVQTVYDWIECAGAINVVTHGLPKQGGLHHPEITVETVPVHQPTAQSASK